MTVILLSKTVPFLRERLEGSRAESKDILTGIINTENRELISILLFMYMQHVASLILIPVL